MFMSLLAAAMTGGVWAMEDAKGTSQAAEYQRSDTNCYLKGDVVKVHSSAVIIAEGSCTRKGDSYFFTPHKKAPRQIYLETLNDWIEPITPPDMPTSLGIAPDAMQIREPQGDVEVALPSAPANFVPVTDGMTLPNGAVVKTGVDGTAAVLFGGVESARLIPNSAAAVQQTVTAQSRSTEVDLTAGGVFSKVGQQVGVTEDYEVHTPFGNAVAHGTDFVTMTTSTRTDVWIAQGTVCLEHPDSKIAETATSDGTGALRILRFPLISDPRQALLADAETLTAVLNFIPLANQKIKALRDKMANGGTLTANEQAYLNRIKEVPCLIKLALVKPSATSPVPDVASAPMPTPVAVAAPPAVAPAPPVPAGPAPIRAVVRVDGKINFQGATYELPGFKSKLEALMQATPDQAIVIRAGKKVSYEKFKAALDICQSAEVKNLSVASPAPQPPPATPAATESSTTNLPAPGLLMHPSMEPMSAAPPEAPSAPPTTNAPPPAGP
jgi:biopolymer transport protein ExbD